MTNRYALRFVMDEDLPLVRRLLRGASGSANVEPGDAQASAGASPPQRGVAFFVWVVITVIRCEGWPGPGGSGNGSAASETFAADFARALFAGRLFLGQGPHVHHVAVVELVTNPEGE